MVLTPNQFRKRGMEFPEIKLPGIFFPIKRYCESATSLPLLNIPHYCAGPIVCQEPVAVHYDMHSLLNVVDEIAVCRTVIMVSHAIGKSEAGCSYCPCREVLRLERFCRTGTKSPNSPIRAGKLHPQAGPGFPAGSDSGLFAPFEAYLAKNFRCTSRNRIPSF